MTNLKRYCYSYKSLEIKLIAICLYLIYVQLICKRTASYLEKCRRGHTFNKVPLANCPHVRRHFHNFNNRIDLLGNSVHKMISNTTICYDSVFILGIQGAIFTGGKKKNALRQTDNKE